ncbi:MAG: NarK/NasA family nitrate transporter [Planctomycetota bacterium]|nr:MFS transporter [Planctomycetota bacterium]MDE1889137.1 NarK/NasA family nitrate transporter [Planctomycetota bacterium]MDE2217425.1 NarK/NasA family nitrate transporter [Planctomycetota bacterium]
MSENVQTPNGNTKVLILATLAFALCFASWSLFAPLAMYLRTEFNLSSTTVGLLIAAPVLLGSVAKIPMGIVTDKYGGRLVFTIMLLFGFLSVFMTSFAHSYGFLLGCGLLFGLIGSSFAVGIPHVSEWYPKKRQGLALGIYGVGNAGTALAAFGVPFIAESMGWNKVFIIYSVPLLFMAFVYWFFTSNAPRSANTKIPTLSEKLKVYKTSGLAWIFCLIYFMFFGLFVCFSIWLPSYLNDFYHISPVKAGSFTSIFVFLSAFTRILGGYLGDRFNGRKIMVFLTIIVLSLTVYLNLNVSLVTSLVLFYVMGICLGTGNGVVYKLVAEYFPKDTGTVGGLVGAAGGLGGFFLPIILGTIRDYTNNYYLGFIFVSLVCLMCLSFMEEKTLPSVNKRAMSAT